MLRLLHIIDTNIEAIAALLHRQPIEWQPRMVAWILHSISVASTITLKVMPLSQELIFRLLLLNDLHDDTKATGRIIEARG
jgi:succinate dehydrogenase/fumarate reductase cytochrome b subunit